MLFSDFLIETSYMELHDNILEGKIDVSEVEVITDSPTEYKAQFYVDEHEVVVTISIKTRGAYEISFSVDDSFDRIDVGARAALVIVRGITKVVSDYLIANKSKVKAVTFEADDRRGRQGVYNILGKSIEAHGYLDFSYIQHLGDIKEYFYVKEGLAEYYSVSRDHDVDGGFDEFAVTVIGTDNPQPPINFIFNLYDTEASIDYMIPITPVGKSIKEVFRKSIGEILNTKLLEWNGVDTILCDKKGGYQDGIIDGIIKRYGYTPMRSGGDSILYKRSK